MSISRNVCVGLLAAAVVLTMAPTTWARPADIHQKVYIGDFLTPVYTHDVSGTDRSTVSPNGTGWNASLMAALTETKNGRFSTLYDLHSHSTLNTSDGYESGTDGLAESDISYSQKFDLQGLISDFGPLDGGSLRLHETVDGTIISGESAFSAFTALSYVDGTSKTQVGFGEVFDSTPGRLLKAYDLIVPLTALPAGTLQFSLYNALTTDARLATNALRPSAEVDVGHTQSILGFGVYDAQGHYLPGFSLVGDDGTLAEYDTVPPSFSGTPEPATWALMIGGLGLAGAALRRRRALA